MPKEPKVIVPTKASDAETYRGTVHRLGTLFIETPQGAVETVEGPGILSMMLTADGREPAIVLLVYDPTPDPMLDGRGMAMIHQMAAPAARSIGASLIKLANELDPQRPN